jgi:hypothetical protein
VPATRESLFTATIRLKKGKKSQLSKTVGKHDSNNVSTKERDPVVLDTFAIITCLMFHFKNVPCGRV